MNKTIDPTPYFSIIIPCLNEEEYLPKLLENLNQQTVKHFDVFVVDGKSTDKTPKLVKKFPSKYPLTLLQTSKRNVSYQRNLGAKRSKGKILVFFDADTLIPNNFMEKIELAFEKKNPDCLTTYVDVDSTKASQQMIGAFTNLGIEIGRIIQFPLSYGAMMAIKRNVFEDIGGFDPATSFAEDSQLFREAVEAKYKYIVLQKPQYTYSLRRYRADGTIDTILKYVRLNISVFLNGYHGKHPVYEMGGGAHRSKSNKPNIVLRFDELFDKMKLATKKQTKSTIKLVNQLFPQD